MRDVLNITDETHAAVATYARRVQETLDNPSRARIEEVDGGDGMKRWLDPQLPPPAVGCAEEDAAVTAKGRDTACLAFALRVRTIAR